MYCFQLSGRRSKSGSQEPSPRRPSPRRSSPRRSSPRRSSRSDTQGDSSSAKKSHHSESSSKSSGRGEKYGDGKSGLRSNHSRRMSGKRSRREKSPGEISSSDESYHTQAAKREHDKRANGKFQWQPPDEPDEMPMDVDDIAVNDIPPPPPPPPKVRNTPYIAVNDLNHPH